MFVDPTAITIDGTAESFARIDEGGGKAVYRTADKVYTLTISRTEGARNRHLVRIDTKKIDANPVTSENAEVSMSVYAVVDTPRWGYTAVDASNVFDGLAAFLTEANLTKVLAGEV